MTAEERKSTLSPHGKSDARPKRRKPQTLTKREIVSRIAEATGRTKADVKDVIQRFLHAVIEELGNENRVEFRDFGIVYVKRRPARKAHNPRTLQKVDVPARTVVKFRVGRLLKSIVSGEVANRPFDPERYADD
jgi:nucleoid DNA-binding protein